MSVKKTDLKTMNDLIGKEATIADIARKFTKYDYWEIYSKVEDYSLLGKKRSISNRLKKLRRINGVESLFLTKNSASFKLSILEIRFHNSIKESAQDGCGALSLWPCIPEWCRIAFRC